MKILFTNFHHRNGGGHVTYILNLLKELGVAHQLSVATPDSSRLYRYARQLPGIEVLNMRYTSRLLPLIGEVWRLRQLIKKERFDIVHVNASADHRHVMLACLGMSRRPKIVWTKHNDHPVNSVGHYLRARFATDQIIAVSDYVRRMLVESAYHKIPTHVIRHGIDTHYFAPVSVVEKQFLRRLFFGSALDGILVLGSVGGTDYDKGWLDLVAAVSQLPIESQRRIQLVVAGDAPTAEKLEKVQALGISGQIMFPGLIDDVRKTLAACDAGFVLSYREALSYACRETLALGLPTLVSDAGGLPENVHDGIDGWIVPAGDVDAIAGVLRQMLSNPGQLRAMGAAARRKSQKDFTLSLFKQRTLAVYRQALF